MSAPTPHDQLIFARHLLSQTERATLRRQARDGELASVSRGVYLDSRTWAAMDRHERYRTRIAAVLARLDPDTVVSHASAAALWRLPWVSAWPTKVHIVTEPAPGGRSDTDVFRHTTGVTASHELIDGIRVTSLARTVADVARTADFGTAVTVADAALRRQQHPHSGIPRAAPSRHELLEQLADIPLHQGVVKARRAIEFADGRADRPGESMSRVSIHRARLEAPQLQERMRGQSGRAWQVDFWWPSFNVIGEFDGKWKYTDPEFMNGRTAQQVLLDEKDREDDLRGANHGFVRWDWPVAVSPTALRARLVAA
ncbi:MAG TPA: hypothetical protein PK781_06335, partial [Terrimesophilobacter sp.]|nr:hypothetical protein [Terrimesophilobacter sp.]